MLNQAEITFRILTEAEIKERLDPSNPKCAFNKYVGNRGAVEEMLDLVNGAYQQRAISEDGEMVCTRCIPKRIALLGPPSSGKTHLARTFAGSLELPYCETDATQLETTEDLFDQLANTFKLNGLPLEVETSLGNEDLYILPSGILFIDEIHMASKSMQDGLLKMTEAKDHVLLLPGKRIDVRNLCILIGTTDKGKLRPAFKTRFRHITLERYNRDEVAQIVRVNYPDWARNDAYEVAKLKPIPRMALDFAETVNLCDLRQNCGRTKAIKIVAEREGVGEFGLTRNAKRVLQLLAE
jgi:Holliday junction resolvasome RuvABC ATP-dependent DNA helicase subunit